MTLIPFFTTRGTNTIPLVAHIPHSSTYIPIKLIDDFAISKEKIDQELRYMTDWCTDEIFSPIANLGGTSLTSNISRLVMDPERYANPEKEPMSNIGMGVIYTHGSHLEKIKKLVPNERALFIMEEIYFPYHRALDRLVSECREKHGYCILIDGHSFFKDQLPYETNKITNRPSICLGINNEQQTPTSLVNTVKAIFEKNGFDVGINEPFSGSIIPGGLATTENIYSIMIEINRKTYMDENFSVIPDKLDNLSEIIRKLSIDLQNISF